MGVIVVHEDVVSSALAEGKLKLSDGRRVNAISMMIKS
jgi:hypothetical protein